MADDEIKNRILDAAQEQFFRFGFSRVTMSEISDELGMSKKTLYAYFPGKADILSSIVRRAHASVEETITALVNNGEMDVAEKLGTLLRRGSVVFSRFNQPFLLDIQRNAPDIWKMIDGFRRDRLQAGVTAIIRQGMESGQFRRDIDPVVIMLIHLAATQSLATAEMLSVLPLSAADVYASVHRVILEGILTDEARPRAKHQNNTYRQEDTVYV